MPPTALMFCEMQTPFEERVSPLILFSDTCCIVKIDGFSTGASFSFLSFSSSTSEIPQFRLPYDVVNFEVELMKDLGVKVNERPHTALFREGGVGSELR